MSFYTKNVGYLENPGIFDKKLITHRQTTKKLIIKDPPKINLHALIYVLILPKSRYVVAQVCNTFDTHLFSYKCF